MSCKPEILVRGDHFHAARCRHCRRIGIYYKTLLLGFDPEDFFTFSRSFSHIQFHRHAQPFPDGLPHIVVRHPHHQDLQMTFTEDEFHEFRDMLRRAIVILEALEALEERTN